MIYCVLAGWLMDNLPTDYYAGFIAGFLFFGALSVIYYKIRMGGNNRKK
jgi:hypothetical protein